MKGNAWRVIIGILGAGMVLLVACLLFCYFRAFHYKDDAVRRRDVEAVTEGSFDQLLLATYSGETVSTYPFEYFLGATTYKPEHEFKNLRDLSRYLEEALVSGETIQRVYTFLDPARMSDGFFFSEKWTGKAYERMLAELIREHAGVEFTFLLSSYSAEYWGDLGEGQRSRHLESYVYLCEAVDGLANVKIFMFGHEDWLVVNPGNYVNEQDCTEEMNNRLVAMSLAGDTYRVNSENIRDRISALQACVERELEVSSVTDDWSEREIVFFGDSIIGNYDGPLSIPGVVTGLTGAETYNCAIGGQPASVGPEVEEALDVALDYFLEGRPENAFEGQSQFQEEAGRFRGKEHFNTELTFVLGYGLNDYFEGHKIEDDRDPISVATYKGALRRAILRLQQEYPRADIVLLTPTYVTYFGNGTERQSSEGGILTEYVEAVLELAEEMNITAINSYEQLGIDGENCWLYLEDGCHMNERGRFLYGSLLIEYMK